MNHLTIGILVTNTDRSAFAQSQSTDGEKFSSLMRAARPQWHYRVYDCTANVFPSSIHECDGYVIGGSPASVNDNDSWIATLLALIQTLHVAKKPVVGCCFGHQAIAKALGGSVGKNPGGWGFGVAATVFSTQQSWMQPPAPSISLYAAHGEQVITVPKDATVIGGNDFCPAASLLVGDHFLTTEYHPEMSQAFFVGLTRSFEAYIGRDVAENARREAEAPAEGQLFAEWMACFLEQPRSS